MSKDKDEADAFNHVFSGNSFFKADLKAGTKTVWQQATNQDLFAKIHTLFSSLDPSDDEALNQSVSEYQSLIETVFATLNGTQGAYTGSCISADNLRALAKSYRNMNIKTYRRYGMNLSKAYHRTADRN